jgi:phosphoglycerol transferase MdoB-like AlkP superfamily enzyme
MRQNTGGFCTFLKRSTEDFQTVMKLFAFLPATEYFSVLYQEHQTICCLYLVYSYRYYYNELLAHDTRNLYRRFSVLINSGKGRFTAGQQSFESTKFGLQDESHGEIKISSWGLVVASY